MLNNVIVDIRVRPARPHGCPGRGEIGVFVTGVLFPWPVLGVQAVAIARTRVSSTVQPLAPEIPGWRPDGQRWRAARRGTPQPAPGGTGHSRRRRLLDPAGYLSGERGRRPERRPFQR